MKKLRKIWNGLSQVSEKPLAGLSYAFMSTILMVFAHFQAQLVLGSSNDSGVSPFEVALIRCIGQVVMLFPFLLVNRSRVLFVSDKWSHLFCITLAGYSVYIMIYYALSFIPLSIALTISATCPFFATVFSIFILKEDFSRLDTLCGFMSFIGVLLIARPTFIFGKLGGQKEVISRPNMSKVTSEIFYLAGCGLALMFGIGRALYLVLVRKWVRESEGNSTKAITVFYPSIFGCLFTPYLILFSGKPMVFPAERYQLYSLLTVGLLTSSGLMCLTLALKSQNATIVGCIRNLEIAWSFILQSFVMKITPSWWSIGGAAILIITTMVNPVNNKIAEMRKNKTKYNGIEGNASVDDFLMNHTNDMDSDGNAERP